MSELNLILHAVGILGGFGTGFLVAAHNAKTAASVAATVAAASAAASAAAADIKKA